MKRILKYSIIFIVLIIFILFVIGQLNKSEIKTGNLTLTKNWQGELMEIDGETIRYLQKGEGQNILLIHGTPGCIEDWQPLIDKLSKNHRVTTFDRLGNGFSTANNYQYTLKENVEFVTKFIQKLDLKNTVVVGHSYGGTIAVSLANLKDKHIKSFVVVAAPLYRLDADFNYTVLASPITGKGITKLVSKYLANNMIEDGLKVTFGNNTSLLTDEFLSIRKQLWSQSKVLYSTSNVRSNFNDNIKESTPNYKNISKKISFLVGENDHSDIVNDFYRIKKVIPQAEFIFLKNTTHFIQFEKTTELIEVINSHLNINTISE